MLLDLLESEVGSRQFCKKNILSGDAKSKTIVVAVPADRSPLLRIRGANRATAIAEYFRSIGKNVLLIMDSLLGLRMQDGKLAWH